jgi:hypothetical protein
LTRDEFMSLPAAVRLEILYQVLHDRLATLPVPSAATSTAAPTPVAAPAGDIRPPRFDTKIGRKGGFCWASEMLLHDLLWWLEKKREGSASGGQYALRDGKLVTELERWVAWRRVAPSEMWRGTRGDENVMADPPRRDPTLHPWGNRPPAKLAPPPPTGGYGDADYGPSTDDDIPF